MADATASGDSKILAATAAPHVAPAVVAAIQPASVEALGSYEDFARITPHAPPQSGLWVRHWVANLHPDALIAWLRIGDRPLLALALEIERSGPFKIARFMGGRHANGNFPPIAQPADGRLTPQDLNSLFDAIKSARPDIDLIALQRLQPDLDGLVNPLSTLPSFPSPNLSLAVDLSGGFEEVLERTSGKRKRKKHRSQARKFEAAGGFARIEARSADETRRLLEAFLAMKEQRFRKMGIANVFGDPRVRAFFHALFAGALDEETPPFLLHGLEVAGKLRAVTGSSRAPRRLICEFGAILEDELSSASPGDFLFFDNIQEACEQGNAVYDFSVGDEPYKRQWCDIEIQHRDVMAALTIKGRALASAMHQGARLKAFIKNSPTIWKIAKALRRRTAGHEQPSTSSDD